MVLCALSIFLLAFLVSMYFVVIFLFRYQMYLIANVATPCCHKYLFNKFFGARSTFFYESALYFWCFSLGLSINEP